MPYLSLKQLCRVIALRLQDCHWDLESVSRMLQRVFPAELSASGADIAAELISAFRVPYAPEADTLSEVLAWQPELQRLHRYCLKHNTWPSHSLEPPIMRPVAPFWDLELPQLRTPADLADWLLLPVDQLDRYVDPLGWREEHGETAVNNYFTYPYKKAAGGYRVIEAPKPRLKSFQRLILSKILSKVPTHPGSFAFTAGRDCRQAAARHAGEELVICFDLKDFFSHVPSARVFGLFRCLGYPSAVAHAFTGLCTVITPSRLLARLPHHQRQALRTPHLPQGAPTSPALANLVAFRLDRRLSGLANSIGCAYSRYADDLAFSGDRGMREAILKAVPKIVRDEGFIINAPKTRIMPAARRQTVTGIVVNQHLNIPRRDFDRLKAIIHAKHWQSDEAGRSQLMGHIGWVEQLNPKKGMKLRRLLERS